MIREPKWGHLRDLHRALRLSKKALLWGSPTVQRIDEGLEVLNLNLYNNNIINKSERSCLIAYEKCGVTLFKIFVQITVYEQPGTDVCAAFLNNNRSKLPTTINFRGADYTLPPRSISILPDCKTVVYNTMTVTIFSLSFFLSSNLPKN